MKMNRNMYYNYIDEKLTTLSSRIITRGRFNLLELNIHSEIFLADLFNILFDYELRNENQVNQNVESIDLIDEKNKVIIQVSATNTKQKINTTLSKESLSKYAGYVFLFIFIGKSNEALKQGTFSNPHDLDFTPAKHIFDIESILKIILNFKIEKQKSVYDLVRAELGNEIDVIKVDTNLAAIINILSQENLSDEINAVQIDSFEIENKIKFNNLDRIKNVVSEYAMYNGKIGEKYTEFDKMGANKSFSVLRYINNLYIKLRTTNENEVDLFYLIIAELIDVIQKSKNYYEISYEELECCVYIIVVDSFIRCKIFENPEGYNYVVTR